MNFEFLHTMIRLLFNKLVVRWKKDPNLSQEKNTKRCEKQA